MTNVHPFDTKETIEEEARTWLIRLDGDDEPSEEMIDSLHAWASRSPAHREELLRISAFWNDANILTELSIPVHHKSAQTHTTESPGFFARLWDSWGFWSRGGAALAFTLLCVVVALQWGAPREVGPGNRIYVTAIGEVSERRLPDGSILRLNTDSQVQVDYSDKLRKLRLLRGEAHFDVSHNPNRPFQVYAGEGMVKAVGTAFSVELDKALIRVTVTEGRVDLASMVEALPENTALPVESTTALATERQLAKFASLDRGQSAAFGNRVTRIDQNNPANTLASRIVEDMQTLAEPELERRLSWRQGYLVFSGEPLVEVVKEVNRYLPLRIDIVEPALRELRIGGRFKVDELEAMFDVLETSFGIEVRRFDNTHIQLSLAEPRH